MTPITAALLGLFLLSGQNVGNLGTTMFGSTPETLPTYTVSMTGYNAVPGQTDSDPFTTASGAYSDPDVVAARSQDLADELPFGTVIAVTNTASSTDACGYSKVDSQIGLRVVADTMNARMKQKIDILLPTASSSNPARVLGVCKNVEIQVVGHVDVNHMPRTQAELKRALVQNLAVKK